MNTTTNTEPVVVLDADQVEQLRHLLGTVEDWLLHCGDEALDDLAAFLAGLGWAPRDAPERLAANLVSELGDQAVSLRTALHRTGQHRPASTTPRDIAGHDREQPLRVEVDHGSTSAKERRPGQVWLVRLHRGNRAVIITTGLARPCADHLASKINTFLHPPDIHTRHTENADTHRAPQHRRAPGTDRADTQTGQPA